MILRLNYLVIDWITARWISRNDVWVISALRSLLHGGGSAVIATRMNHLLLSSLIDLDRLCWIFRRCGSMLPHQAPVCWVVSGYEESRAPSIDHLSWAVPNSWGRENGPFQRTSVNDGCQFHFLTTLEASQWRLRFRTAFCRWIRVDQSSVRLMTVSVQLSVKIFSFEWSFARVCSHIKKRCDGNCCKWSCS